MYKNGLTYGKCTTIVLLTHIIMLLAILLRGKYDTPQDILPLAVAVIGLDLTYSIVLRFLYRQMTYTLRPPRPFRLPAQSFPWQTQRKPQP